MTFVEVLQLANPVQHVFGQVRGGGYSQQVDVGSMLLWLGIAAVATAAVSVAVFFSHRAALRRRLNSHSGLFDGLCRVHNLTRGQRVLLRQIVQVHTPTYPCQVFTEPIWTHPQSLPAALRGKAADLGKLHKKLFG
ncbi:MAG: hypothetical protein RBS80_01885 [Thermoguttaceae bacterium]|jgi:hypothetical protein|nr:hypothetical protein [Thermoguttaceae bacterium]